ncbi:TlpA family protein disulfide reductase [Paludibacter jiangxiensis]|uniref:Thiol-disulfide isomerase or thioredoxin n=1 Tax=Paludibacter jiangxiensis TaxID=681398 RepID=A0A161LS96_9BACT|nr:thioredoxin family protein [Paludibacter jiangxiensis]GAT63570.1 thiol-disulfide isomerase or thioredoxin [Paludibacter jiangxiensis]
MKQIILISLVTILAFGKLQAKENSIVTLTVHDNPNSTYRLAIAEPLDGCYNSKASTYSQIIKDGSEVTFVPKQKSPSIITVDVGKHLFKIIIVPNNKIHVDIYPQIPSNDGVVFSGDNAAGQKWLNENVAAATSMNIQAIFKANKKNYPLIYRNIFSYADASQHYIDSLKKATSISDSFATMLERNKLAEIYFFAINEYNALLFRVRNSDFTDADSIAIRDSQNKIFENFAPYSHDLFTYCWGKLYFQGYFYVVYHNTSSSDKRYLPVFGSYGTYGILPEDILRQMLGETIVSQYIYNLNEFDKEKATAYFREKYPDSEYLPVIDRLAAKAKESSKTTDKNVNIENPSVTKNQKPLKGTLTAMPFDKAIHIDTSAVTKNLKSLKELHETYFKGKKIFIDLWATWCRPCREEFAYKDRVDSLLELHHILPVFLSIDIPDFKQRWIHDVIALKLSGHHFMVNEILKEDIRKTIYDAKPMIDIPQYIYMDEDGNIINKDAPRPSNIRKLEKLLSSQ